MGNKELKPCPICGSVPSKRYLRNWVGGYSRGTSMIYICCDKCKRRTILYHWDDEELAILAWNNGDVEEVRGKNE